MYDIRGQIDKINAITQQKEYSTYNQLNITIANAEADGIKRDYSDKSIELNSYLNEMITTYDSLRNSLGESWEQMNKLITAIEFKNNNYISKNLEIIPDSIKAIINFKNIN